MSPSRVTRILTRCSTVARALRASERVRRMGLPWLADALWCQAMALWAVGYPESQAMYQQRRDERLGEILARMPKAEGAKGRGKKADESAVPVGNHTLSEAGITKKESSQCQRLASLSAAEEVHP